MATGLKEIAAKARREPKLVFTTLAHHITQELLWESLGHIPTRSARGTDSIDVKTAKETFRTWVGPMLQSMHRKGYKAPLVRRVWIPKPGKKEKRPLGIPCIPDRALQRSTAQVLTAIYEQDFLKCSFGGRPKLSAHHALVTLTEVIMGKKVGWVFEADLKNYFGSLDHEWLLRFVKLRVGDPRIISLIERWIKAGILDNGKVSANELGTPQGGSISVLLSNIYLHYVLDLWFEKVVKPRMRGEVYLIRYIDDFVVCFQYHADAQRFREALSKRLNKFALELEPSKTRLVKFGRFAESDAKAKGKRLETIYFLGFTHYCTRSRKGNFMVGRKTEKTRYRRSIHQLNALMREIRHYPPKDQVKRINLVLQGHYAYYGLGGNIKSLQRFYHMAQRCWHNALSSRSWKSYISWDKFQKMEQTYPLRQPKLKIPFHRMEAYAVL